MAVLQAARYTNDRIVAKLFHFLTITFDVTPLSTPHVRQCIL